MTIKKESQIQKADVQIRIDMESIWSACIHVHGFFVSKSFVLSIGSDRTLRSPKQFFERVVLGYDRVRHPLRLLQIVS